MDDPFMFVLALCLAGPIVPIVALGVFATLRNGRPHDDCDTLH